MPDKLPSRDAMWPPLCRTERWLGVIPALSSLPSLIFWTPCLHKLCSRSPVGDPEMLRFSSPNDDNIDNEYPLHYLGSMGTLRYISLLRICLHVVKILDISSLDTTNSKQPINSAQNKTLLLSKQGLAFCKERLSINEWPITE